jgi:nitrite reductase (NO-forming)
MRNVYWLKTTFRVLLGIVWVINGALKFQNDFASSFPSVVQSAQDNAPSWLQGWYSFWVTQATLYPTQIVYTVGFLELIPGFALIFGFMRKFAYVGGVLLSLAIWAVPEGFGGSYGPGTTDIGTGAVYALVFLGLIVISAAFGPTRWSLDYLIERRWPKWAIVAEISSQPPLTGSKIPGSPGDPVHPTESG